MARVAVTVTPAPGIGAGVKLVATAANAGLGHSIANVLGSRVLLIVKNAQAAATVQVTLKAVSGSGASDIVVVIPATKTYVFGPLPANLYTQPSGADVGSVQINLDVDTTVTLFGLNF